MSEIFDIRLAREEIARLEAELADVPAALCIVLEASIAHTGKQNARIAALEAALVLYGNHNLSCKKMSFSWSSPCDCGFHEATIGVGEI